MINHKSRNFKTLTMNISKLRNLKSGSKRGTLQNSISEEVNFVKKWE